MEMDLVSFTYDSHNPDRDGSEFTQWNVAPVNLKVGLLNNVDLQLMIDPFVDQQIRASIWSTVGTSWFQGVTTRVKVNLWGNDGGPTALALMPFVGSPGEPRAWSGTRSRRRPSPPAPLWLGNGPS